MSLPSKRPKPSLNERKLNAAEDDWQRTHGAEMQRNIAEELYYAIGRVVTTYFREYAQAVPSRSLEAHNAHFLVHARRMVAQWRRDNLVHSGEFLKEKYHYEIELRQEADAVYVHLEPSFDMAELQFGTADLFIHSAHSPLYTSGREDWKSRVKYAKRYVEVLQRIQS